MENIQLQVLCRLGIQICNIRFMQYEITDKKNYNTIERIANIYIKTLMKLGTSIITRDEMMLREWYRFKQHFSEQVARVLK